MRTLARIVGFALRAVLRIVFVVLLLVTSLLVQLDTGVVRRVAVARVNQLVFKPLFQGQLVILAVDHLDPFGVAGASVRIIDPQGQQALAAEGVDGRFGTLALLESLARGKGDIMIDLPRVRIRHVDIRLDLDDAGMALASTFFPRHPSTSPPTPFDGHGVHVYAPHVQIDHAWGHGQMLTLPYFDGDVTRLDAAFALTPTGLSVEARRGNVVARGIALGADAKGAFDGVFAMTLEEPQVMSGRFRWDGTAGTLHETARAKLDANHFDATIDVNEASPEAIRSLWPGSPLTGTGTAHLEAHGPLEAIDLAAHAALDAATLDVHGELAWRPQLGAKLHVDVAGFDVRQVAPLVASSSLGVAGDVRLDRSDTGRLAAQAELDFARGHVGRIPTPHVTLHANAFHEPAGPFGGDASLIVDEPGAPTTITLHATPTARSTRIAFDIASRDVRLGAITRVHAGEAGSARVSGKGSLDLDTLALEAAVDAHVNRITRGPLSVAAGSITGHAHGNVLDPRVDVEVHAQDVRYDDVRLTSVDVAAHGHARSPHVQVREQSVDVPNLEAEVDLDLLDGPALRRADLVLTRRGESAHVRADRVRFAGDAIAVEGVRVEGLGAPMVASFDLVGNTLGLRAKAPRLEVLRVAKLLGIDDVVRGGVLSFDADVSLQRERASGRARIELDGGSVGPFDGITARIDGRLMDRRFAGKASVRAGEIGFLEMDATTLGVGGAAPLTRASWKEVWGDVQLKGHVDLARLAADLSRETLPFAAVRGAVDLDGRLARDSATDFTPTIDLTVTTTGLFVTGKASPVALVVPVVPAVVPVATPAVTTSSGAAPAAATPAEKDAPGPMSAVVPIPLPPATPVPTPATHPAEKTSSWTLEGVDLTATVHVNGDTGFSTLNAHVRDARGDMAVLDAESSAIPYEALNAAPSNALALLGATPFDARVAIPAQPLDRWPPGILHLPIDGKLKADLDLKGPLSAPQFRLTARLTHVLAAPTRLTAPVELDLDASYDGAHAQATMHGVRDAREVLTAELQGSVSAKDLVAGNADLAWDASAKVHVAAFPLATVGPLDDRQIRGNITGDVTIADLHKDAKARATIEVSDLRIGEALYPDAHATFVADGKTIDAEARVDQKDGYGSLKATVAGSWGAALFPTPDPHHNLDLSFVAKHFRAAVFMPFVQGPVDELDGILDGTAQATVDPVTQDAHVHGTLALSEGLFELASFGGELHDITGKLTVTPEGLLTLEGFSASGISGQLLAAASARLNGLRLEGATATVQIPRSRPFPLSINGAPLGSVDGKLTITESMAADGHTLLVKADIPTFHLVVPESGSQDVQTLGPIAGVAIGTRGAPGGTFVVEPTSGGDNDATAVKARATDAMVVQIDTHFGNDVAIRRGSDLRVELTGGPTVTIAETTHVSGQIQLHGGVLNLYGKTFDIETGTVTFVGEDASNPQVRVTAGWSAPEGTQVKADFIGPLKTGKVTLRSEPPLGRNDIVQLLLFGTTDGEVANATAAAPPGAYSAGGVAGNIATQPLNRALDQFGLSAVSAKVDTSSANAKPEVEVQIAKNISVELAHVLYLGPPPPGTAPDTTLLTVDWRFLRKWSLEATVGNAGSTIVDLVWQYRY